MQLRLRLLLTIGLSYNLLSLLSGSATPMPVTVRCSKARSLQLNGFTIFGSEEQKFSSLAGPGPSPNRKSAGEYPFLSG